MKHILLLLLSVFCNTIAADELLPFKSDGCSAFLDGTIEEKNLWLNCCYEHDKSYWMGGTYQERLDADSELRIWLRVLGNRLLHS